MAKVIVAVATLALLSAGSARAAEVAYAWEGMGVNVAGSSKCSTYKMAIGVTVDGNTVKGVFRQQGRDERRFEAVLDAKGTFKGKAAVGGGSMDVSGVIADKESAILLDGYCKFGGKLTKK